MVFSRRLLLSHRLSYENAVQHGEALRMKARPADLVGDFHQYRCRTVEFCLKTLFVTPTEIGFCLERNPRRVNYFNVVDVEF
jgi:hypothetical protein